MRKNFYTYNSPLHGQHKASPAHLPSKVSSIMEPQDSQVRFGVTLSPQTQLCEEVPDL